MSQEAQSLGPTDTVGAQRAAEQPAGRQRNIFSAIWHFNRRWPVLPGFVLSSLVIMAIFAPLFAPTAPDNTASRLGFSSHAPTWGRADEHTGPEPVREDFATSAEFFRARNQWHADSWYILGADLQGRDILSRVIFGARVSLQVAAIGLVSGIVVGTLLGLLAGYFGGVVDEIVGRFVDIWLALPFILLALALSVVWTARGWNNGHLIYLLIGLLAWTGFVRQVRADALTIRSRDYVLAAKIAGGGHIRIMWKHVLPGTFSTVLVVASLAVGGLILAESILSFLGVGFPDPVPAWGKSVSDGRDELDTAPWISMAPGIMIFLTVMSFNFIGDWLRDRLDPRLRQLD